MAASIGAHVKSPSKDVLKLLTRYPVLEYQQENNKIKCSLSGHEMPCKADAILSYVSGKKFLKVYKDKEFGYETYKPHLVRSIKKRQEHLLFCKLTVRHINKTPQDVKRHVNGKRYKRALQQWQKCEESGEKFQPHGRRKKQEREDTDSSVPEFWDLDEEEDSKSDSDMSDLFPGEDFKSIKKKKIVQELDSDSEDLPSQNNVHKAGKKHKGTAIKKKGNKSKPL